MNIKRLVALIGIISILVYLVFVLLIVSLGYIYFSRNYTTLHLSPAMCSLSLNGTMPDTFCETKGSGTWLEGEYLFARLDRDGCLIITLKNDAIAQWKNTFIDLQVLQCVLGEERGIGITVDYSMDFFHLMETADTCGFEISEDFSKIVESPEDNSWYFPFTIVACARMQMFEGKPCSEIYVEHTSIDEYGNVIETIVLDNQAMKSMLPEE